MWTDTPFAINAKSYCLLTSKSSSSPPAQSKLPLAPFGLRQQECFQLEDEPPKARVNGKSWGKAGGRSVSWISTWIQGEKAHPSSFDITTFAYTSPASSLQVQFPTMLPHIYNMIWNKMPPCHLPPGCPSFL